MSWIFLVLLYGIIKGFRDVIKKKALTKNTVMETLFAYTLLTFLFCIPDINNAIKPVPFRYNFLIPLKSFVIFLAWICSYTAIDRIPISIYGVIDLSRIFFSTLFGILILGENTSIYQITGFILIVFGLLYLKIYPTIASKRSNTYIKEDIKFKFVILTLASCILNAISACMDKVYLSDIKSSQLQFWYMFYLVLFYGLYFIFTRTRLDLTIFKNGWIWLLSLLFFIADKALFIANENPASKISVMTLIKQSACIISILSGKFIFKEKNIGYKLFCAFIVVLGIIIAVQ